MKEQPLNIIDLISEKHIVLRREVEERWTASGENEISHTEALLLAKVKMGKISLAEVARQANISRQAMHKCAKHLEEKGYINFETEGNKYAVLTAQGEAYCQKSEVIKQNLEEEIARRIGKEQMAQLKALLRENWLQDL